MRNYIIGIMIKLYYTKTLWIQLYNVHYGLSFAYLKIKFVGCHYFMLNFTIFIFFPIDVHKVTQ